jgi:hypothetical protein
MIERDKVTKIKETQRCPNPRQWRGCVQGFALVVTMDLRFMGSLDLYLSPSTVVTIDKYVHRIVILLW